MRYPLCSYSPSVFVVKLQLVVTRTSTRRQKVCSRISAGFSVAELLGALFNVTAAWGNCRASSRMVAAHVRRRILARKTAPPRHLGGYGSCNDSYTHPG